MSHRSADAVTGLQSKCTCDRRQIGMRIMEIKFRITPMYVDSHNIREIVNSTGFFYNHEVEVAVELLEERLKTGIERGYYFVFADAVR